MAFNQIESIVPVQEKEMYHYNGVKQIIEQKTSRSISADHNLFVSGQESVCKIEFLEQLAKISFGA